MIEKYSAAKMGENEWIDHIEELNNKSWFVMGCDKEPIHPFIAMSIGSIGPSRETDFARTALAGNMSEFYGNPDIPKEDWPIVANKNVNRFLKSLNILVSNVRALFPQRDYRQPLNMINVDTDQILTNPGCIPKTEERGDFIYTYNPEVVLAVKPADCPVIISVGKTEKGPILCYTHIAWGGANAGYIDQMFENFSKLGIKLESLRMYVSGGAHAENYHYKNMNNPLDVPGRELLFKNVIQNESGEYHYDINTPVFIRDELLKNGISDYQIFEDTSDTARLDTGYSSHSRAANSGGTETDMRDILVASLGQSWRVPKSD